MSIPSQLDTGIKQVRNVGSLRFGQCAFSDLSDRISDLRARHDSIVYFVDHYFREAGLPTGFPALADSDRLVWVDSTHEPKTTGIDILTDGLRDDLGSRPVAMIGMGGGSTMDTTKAVANLWTNGGKAADYQGWDLVRKPGAFKILIPTLSGTGAEATRTCVMTNTSNGLKLGMNSDFTVADEVILDPDLTASAPRNQYFYTGMDAYIHCMESLRGMYRHPVGDAYSEKTLDLCRDVFLADDMMTSDNRSALMVASYLGGSAIAMSYVGVVHPFSAGLSVVLGTHHCIGNCIVMRAMESFYPEGYEEFWTMVDRQGVDIPENVCAGLTDEQFEQMYQSTVIHEKPLINALGEDFRDILTKDRVRSIFELM